MMENHICLFMEGDLWCTVFPDFVDLMASPAGFGQTADQAIADLHENCLK